VHPRGTQPPLIAFPFSSAGLQRVSLDHHTSFFFLVGVSMAGAIFAALPSFFLSPLAWPQNPALDRWWSPGSLGIGMSTTRLLTTPSLHAPDGWNTCFSRIFLPDHGRSAKGARFFSRWLRPPSHPYRQINRPARPSPRIPPLPRANGKWWSHTWGGNSTSRQGHAFNPRRASQTYYGVYVKREDVSDTRPRPVAKRPLSPPPVWISQVHWGAALNGLSQVFLIPRCSAGKVNPVGPFPCAWTLGPPCQLSTGS